MPNNKIAIFLCSIDLYWNDFCFADLNNICNFAGSCFAPKNESQYHTLHIKATLLAIGNAAFVVAYVVVC
jgi:hypothetical protein